MSLINNNKAFTLIELVVSVAIIAFLASVTFVAVNPSKRIGDAKDAIRLSDSLAIEKALEKAIVENYAVPTAMASLTDDTPYMLVTDGGSTSGNCDCNTLDESIARIDIAADFKDYVGDDVPIDDDATGDDTGYYVVKRSNTFKVSSCNAYGDEFDTPCNGFSRPFCPDMTMLNNHGVEDGVVDFEDMMYISLGFGTCQNTDPEKFETYYKADFNNDCCIDQTDMDCYGAYHGQSIDCATFTGTCS